MKSILKLFLAFIIIPLLFVGCKDDDFEPITKASDLRLSDPSINTVILKVNKPTENAFLISWDDYTTGSGEYTVQVSKEENFEMATDLGTTSEKYFTYSMGDFNQTLLSLDYTPYLSTPVYIRVAKGNMVSNSINFMVQTYPSNNAVISMPTANEQIELSLESAEEVAYTFSWNDYAYQNGNANVTYTIQFAKAGTDFSPTREFTSNQAQLALKHRELNDVAIDLGLEPENFGDLEMKVISNVSTPTNETITLPSEAVTFSVKPYVPDNKLYFVGTVQSYYGINAWTPTEAMELRYIGDNVTKVFEGYIKLAPNDEFKLINKQANWGEFDGEYGYDQDGKIKNGGGNIKPNLEEGLYYIKVDVDNLTYQLVKMNWGIIGDATANGWDSETAMEYDFNANQFKYDGHLNAGNIKFRAGNVGQEINNNPWAFNVGSGNVAWDNGDGNIQTEDKDYNITLAIDVKGNVTKSGL